MKNTKTLTKRLLQFFAMIAAIVAIVLVQIRVAKYLITRRDEAEINLYEYRIAVSEIELDPGAGTYTGSGVDITITASRPDVPNLSVEYKVGDGAWTPYTGPFTVTDNGSVSARYVSSIDNFEGPVTEINVTNIGVARIGSTVYKTLAEAIEACPLNAGNTQTTIEMLADVTENVTIPATKNIVIDLAGNDITSATASTVTVAGKLNLIDSSQGGAGELSSSSGVAVTISNGGEFTLGIEDQTTSVTSPKVTGQTSGVSVENGGQFNFYDGVVTGNTQDAIVNNGNIATPNNYVVTTEEDGNKEIATLSRTYEITFDLTVER